jgi:hypothetical protein
MHYVPTVAIHQLCPHITVDGVDRNEHEADTISVHLMPLFVFSNLTNVDLLSYIVRFGLDDSIVRDMAMARPRPRFLAFKDCCSNYSYPCVTILGLVPLAQHCSELQTLKIRFDARSLPALVPNTLAARNETLKELEVSTPLIAEPEWVATFLYDTFPRARLVRIERGEEWKQVSDLIHAFGVHEQWWVKYHDHTNPT